MFYSLKSSQSGLSFLLLLGLFLQAGCQSNSPTDWLQVPINACIESNVRIVERSQPVMDYCNCLIPKVYESVRNDRGKVLLLREGKLDFLITTTDPTLFAISQTCLPAEAPPTKSRKLSEFFDDRIERGIRLSMNDAYDEAFKESHDFEAYCNCVMEELKSKFMEAEYKNPDFPQSEKYLKMKAECEKKWRK